MDFLGRLAFSGLLAGSLYFGGTPVVAQSACGLDARNLQNVPLPALSPGAVPSALASTLQRSYRLLLIDHRRAEAEPLLRQVLRESNAAGNLCGEALANYALGVAVRQTRPPDALPYLFRAQDLFEQAGTPAAKAFAQFATTDAEDRAHHRSKPRSPNELAGDLAAAGDPANSIEQRSLVALSDAPSDARRQAALWDEIQAVTAANAVMVRGLIQFRWARAFARLSQQAPAMEHFHAALAQFQHCACAPEWVGATYLQMADMATVAGDGERTRDYTLVADRVFSRAHLDSSRPLVLRALGMAYAHLKDEPRAISTFQQSLTLAEEQGLDTAIPNIVVGLAQNYGWAQQPFQGLELLDKYQGRDMTPLMACGWKVLRMELDIEALLWQRAENQAAEITKCQSTFSPLITAHFEFLYARAETEEGHLEEALHHAQQSVAIVEAQRAKLEETDANLASFDEVNHQYYDALLDVLSRLHRAHESLLVAEQMRARAFLDLLESAKNDISATPSAVTPPAVSEQRVADQTPPSRSHPFMMTAAELDGVAAREQTTLLSYWLSTDRLYIWVLRPGAELFETSVSVPPQRLRGLVHAALPSFDMASRSPRARTRGGTDESVVAGNLKPWRELYQLLIAPIEDALPRETGSRITIVPQDELFELPFGALMDGHGKYLVERYAINTTPSVSVLQQTERNAEVASALPPHYLFVADPQNFPLVDGMPLSPLPGTDAEVKAISRTLEKDRFTLLEGSRAGIDTMTESLPQTTVLHMATHAMVRDKQPLTSFLALDRSQRGGVLSAARVYGLRLHAGLVVLSACSTGRGKITGDGIAGLSRAFFYAGAASLVTTLWDVIDEPTARLMPRFYLGLSRGDSRSAALRDAQLSLIADLRLHRVRVRTSDGGNVVLPEAPAFWAAYSLSGQP